jgi:hypothetical protein
VGPVTNRSASKASTRKRWIFSTVFSERTQKRMDGLRWMINFNRYVHIIMNIDGYMVDDVDGS